MKRRRFFKTLFAIPLISGVLKSLSAMAEWNVDAFTAETESEVNAVFFDGREILDSDKIKIGVHDLVENGAVVPVKINADLPAVSSVSIIVEKNPNPLIAHFNLSPECRAFVATRIKMSVPSDIIAVVESGGRLYSTRKFVEVVEGGCG